jgi:putative transposase
MDETYVGVKGTWKYLYRAVDKAGATVDFPPDRQTGSQSRAAVLAKAIKWNGTPEKITIAALESHTAETEANIVIRRIKYLNNIVEQDHRAIKRLVRSMLGFKSFQAAVTLAGIELMHTIRKASCGRQAKCGFCRKVGFPSRLWNGIFLTSLALIVTTHAGNGTLRQNHGFSVGGASGGADV